MSIQLNHSLTEKKIEKAMKQLPYTQSKQEFLMTAIGHYVRSLIKDKTIQPYFLSQIQFIPPIPIHF